MTLSASTSSNFAPSSEKESSTSRIKREDDVDSSPAEMDEGRHSDTSEDLPPLELDANNTKTALGTRNIVIAVVLAVIATVGFSKVNSFLGNSPSQDLYSVVFDAGSTGSRMFVFHFKIKVKDQIGVRLEKEVFMSVEPGISSYARNPVEAAESLQPLLARAMESVPQNYQPYTLVTFKATAGLRLLPEAKAESILSEVRNLLTYSPFYLPDPKKIEIMSGEEEGLFGWITVNFLLDVIWDEDPFNSVTAFDLGGGSTQVTFEISRMEDLVQFVVKDLFKLRLLGSEFNVFTKSYLGYGLKSARLGIMGGTEGPDGSITYDLEVSDQLDTEDVILFSPCYHAGINFTFIHADVLYIVKGKNPDRDLLPKCKVLVDHFVATANFIQAKDLNRREIHLFSYFFDVARWAKLIPWNEHKHMLTPQDFYNAAKKYCHLDSFSRKRLFLCMDLLYIHSMLTNGIGLSSDKELNVESQLLGREVSWSLGAALSTLWGKFSYSPIVL